MHSSKVSCGSQWKAFSLMLVGLALGFCVGLLPGIAAARRLLDDSLYFKMSPPRHSLFYWACIRAATTVKLRRCFSVCPARRFQGTVVDGYPDGEKGEAGRALGAALMSSLLGALIGAFAPRVSDSDRAPAVLTFGSARNVHALAHRHLVHHVLSGSNTAAD